MELLPGITSASPWRQAQSLGSLLEVVVRANAM